MKSKKQIEKELVSCAGTLIYLGKVSATLANMPLVPLHMAGAMDSTENALKAIPMSINAANNAVHKDSSDTVAQWLLINKLTLGSAVTAKLVYDSDASFSLEGKLESALVYQNPIAGLRGIALRLSPFELTLTYKKTRTKLASAKAVLDRPQSYYVSAFFSDVTPDSTDGDDPIAINILLPIQQDRRLRQERTSRPFIVRS